MKVTYQGDPPTYTVLNGASFTVKLTPLDGEEGRFIAHSQTRYYCQPCGTRFTRKADGICQRCGNEAEAVPYMVDVRENAGRGKCSCESFTCNRRDLKGDEQLDPCKHVAAAFVLYGHFKAAEAAELERKRKIAAEQASRATYSHHQ